MKTVNVVCLICSAGIPERTGQGRPAIYCSVRCRRTAERGRGMTAIACSACGAYFWGRRNRVYCAGCVERRRKPIRPTGTVATQKVCPMCRVAFTDLNKAARPRTYCSPTCRKRAHDLARAWRVEFYTCCVCERQFSRHGNAITAPGDHDYCSDECRYTRYAAAYVLFGEEKESRTHVTQVAQELIQVAEAIVRTRKEIRRLNNVQSQ